MKHHLSSLVVGVCMALLYQTTPAFALSFTDFTSTPGSAVFITSGGLTATLSEDVNLTEVSLEKTWDVVPDFTGLSLDFTLLVPENNEDYFQVYVDANPVYSFGGVTNANSDPFLYNGSILLTSLGLASGQTLRLAFACGLYADGLDSILTLKLTDSSNTTSPVPEPGSALLMASGLLGLYRATRSRKATGRK